MSSVFLRKEMDAEALGTIQSPPVCDWCGIHAPRYVYAASRTSIMQEIFCWRWAACPDCAEHVESENFTPLILEISATIKRNVPVLPPKLIRQCVDQALGEFRQYAIRNRAAA